MDLSTAVVLTGYSIASLARARVLLRQRMTEIVCTTGEYRRCDGHHTYPRGSQHPVMARGEFRARTLRDVGRCVWRGLWWPLWLVWWTFRRLHEGVTWAVLFASRVLTPATDAERARAYNEASNAVALSAKRLEQATKQLDERPRRKPSPRPRKQGRHAADPETIESAGVVEAGEILRAWRIGAPLTNEQLAGAYELLAELLAARTLSVTDVRALADLPKLPE